MNATSELQIEQVSVNALRPDTANPRRISDAELETLTRSIREFGFVDPVIARREDFAPLEAVFADRARWSKVAPLVEGGRERQDSVRNGILVLDGAEPRDRLPEWVLVHDGARPFCPPVLLERLLAALREWPAVVPTLPIFDTVRRLGPDGGEVVERSNLVRCQTPQGFHLPLLRRAHQRAWENGTQATDDAQLVETLGERIHFVPGDERNFKITAEDDFRVAEQLLNDPRRRTEQGK